MRRPRFTIGRCMGWIAILALNAGLVRAFLVEQMFTDVILLLFVLQFALWCVIRCQGQSRSYWIGLGISGLLVVAALFCGAQYPDSALNGLVKSYVWHSEYLAFAHASESIDHLLNLHLDLVFAVVYFVPELAIVVAGGVIAAALGHFGRRPVDLGKPRSKSVAVRGL
jgi:hypothetical protein